MRSPTRSQMHAARMRLHEAGDPKVSASVAVLSDYIEAQDAEIERLKRKVKKMEGAGC